MLSFETRRLARQIRRVAHSSGARVRHAKVVYVGASDGRVTLKLGKDRIVGVRHLAVSKLSVGDNVWVLQQGRDLFILDKLATGTNYHDHDQYALDTDLPEWAPQTQELINDESNLTLAVNTDLMASTNVTLPTGWGSMLVVVTGFVTINFNPSTARGVGSVAFDLVAPVGTGQETWGVQMYHETAAMVQQTIPYNPKHISMSATTAMRSRCSAYTPAAGGSIARADIHISALKLRVT